MNDKDDKTNGKPPALPPPVPPTLAGTPLLPSPSAASGVPNGVSSYAASNPYLSMPPEEMQRQQNAYIAFQQQQQQLMMSQQYFQNSFPMIPGAQPPPSVLASVINVDNESGKDKKLAASDDQATKKKGKEKKTPAKKIGKAKTKVRQPNFTIKECIRIVKAASKVQATNNATFIKKVPAVFKKLRDEDEEDVERDGKSLLSKYNNLANMAPDARKKAVEKDSDMEEVFELLDEWEAKEAAAAGIRTTKSNHPRSLDSAGDDETGEDKKRRARLQKQNEVKKKEKEKKEKMQTSLLSTLDALGAALAQDSGGNGTGTGMGPHEMMARQDQALQTMMAQQRESQQRQEKTLQSILTALTGLQSQQPPENNPDGS